MKKLVILIMLIILVISIAHAESLMSPTINNGSLEGSSAGYWSVVGNPTGWTYVGDSPWNYDVAGGHGVLDGELATSLVGSGSYTDTKPIMYLFPSYTITADTSYEMSFYAQKSTNWVYPALKAVAGDGSKTTISPYLEGTINSSGDEWQKFTINTGRVPAGLVGQQLEVSIWGWNAWATVDNVTVDATALPPIVNLVTNGSFEDPIIPETTEWIQQGPNGWDNAGRTYMGFVDGTERSGGGLDAWGVGPAPDGGQVAFTNVSYLTQYNIVQIQPNTTYNVSLWIGAGDLPYPANPYDIQLGATNVDKSGWITLVQRYNQYDILPGVWQKTEFSYTTTALDPAVGKNLAIYLAGLQGELTYDMYYAYFDDVVITKTSTSTGFSLSGTVNLLDFGGDKTTIPVVVNLNGTDYPLNLDADGKFTILNVAAGTYDVYIKASHWLAKMTSGVVVSANTDIGTVNVINGDVVDNNEVDFSDINATRAAYGSFPGDETWNERADVDGSLEVDFTDINIVRGNYGEIGD